MKTCPQCGSKMESFLNNSRHVCYVNKTPKPWFVEPETQLDISSECFICLGCGLVQEYVPKEELEDVLKKTNDLYPVVRFI